MISNGPFALTEVAKNIAMGIGPLRSMRLRGNRTSLDPTPEQAYRYAFYLPDLVLKHVGSVEGKDLIEIGPGDHLATALTFLALGAKSYTALDRFPGAYSSPNARAWYRLTRQRFLAQFGRPWPSDLSAETFPDDRRIKVLPLSIEDLGDCGQFDLVCSFAVGEHVSDVDIFAAANFKLLRDGGSALHYVDFGGHVWERDPKDPLMFRRIPGFIWNAMGSNRGYPNRVPFEEFNAKLERAGLNVKLASTKPFAHNSAVQEAIYVLQKRLQ